MGKKGKVCRACEGSGSIIFGTWQLVLAGYRVRNNSSTIEFKCATCKGTGSVE